MNNSKLLKKMQGRRETAIEDAIMAHPEALGFPGALAIRNCRISMPTGRVDLVLLPRDGPVRLVLIEAKASGAQDAASKVVGQLLMYYAGALMLGSVGLHALQNYAVKHAERAQSTSPISPKMLSGGISPPAKAFEALYQGRPLTPSEVYLFVALDGEAHRALEPTLLALRKHHHLHIGLVLVRGSRIERVSRPDSG